MIYLIGSLNNPNIVDIENKMHEAGLVTFAQWMCSGPDADQHWKEYGKRRGWSYMDTVKSSFVQTAFNFDFKHMQESDTCVLVMPAGKSAHCEFGWFVGTGRKAYILFDGEPDRPDLMPPNLATGVFFGIDSLIEELLKYKLGENPYFAQTNTSTDQFREVVYQSSGLHPSIPRLGISCSCSDCLRNRGSH